MNDIQKIKEVVTYLNSDVFNKLVEEAAKLYGYRGYTFMRWECSTDCCGTSQIILTFEHWYAGGDTDVIQETMDIERVFNHTLHTQLIEEERKAKAELEEKLRLEKEELIRRRKEKDRLEAIEQAKKLLINEGILEEKENNG